MQVVVLLTKEEISINNIIIWVKDIITQKLENMDLGLDLTAIFINNIMHTTSISIVTIKVSLIFTINSNRTCTQISDKVRKLTKIKALIKIIIICLMNLNNNLRENIWLNYKPE